MNSTKKTARLAGFLYLMWIITGLFAMFYVPSQINTKGDTVNAAQQLLAKEFLFRTGIVNDLISSTIWIFMVLVFYRLFNAVDERQTKLLFALVIVQIPVVFIISAFNIASLKILKGEILTTFELSQRQDLALLFLNISDYGVLAFELFWGLWLFPLAVLIYKSVFLPRFLGIWLFINGIVYVVLSFIGLLLPQYKDTAFNIAIPAMLGELVLMLWLLIMGANEKRLNDVPSRA